MNFTASIQARMGSERLPGKVLKNIYGKPMIQWQYERISKSKYIDRVIVATTLNSADDDIEIFCKKNNFLYFRGSENNVLERISNMIEEFDVNYHLEFHGDSPLIDPKVIDECIEIFKTHKNNFDFFSSAIKTSYPPGMEVTIYSGKILQEVNQAIDTNDPLREHAGYNITRFPLLYKQYNFYAPEERNYPNFYLEVDQIEDFNLVSKIISFMIENGKYDFSIDDIISWMKDNPIDASSNKSIHRRWAKYRD